MGEVLGREPRFWGFGGLMLAAVQNYTQVAIENVARSF